MSRKFLALLLVVASVFALGQSNKGSEPKTTTKKAVVSGRELSFSEALAQARINSKTKAGEDFDVLLSTEFVKRHGHSLDRCTAIPNADLRPFDIVMKLASDGSSSNLMVWPETNVSTCVKKDIVGEVFPKPPHRNYWAHIFMELLAE